MPTQTHSFLLPALLLGMAIFGSLGLQAQESPEATPETTGETEPEASASSGESDTETEASTPGESESNTPEVPPTDVMLESDGEVILENQGAGTQESEILGEDTSMDLIPLREGEFEDPGFLDLPTSLGPAEPGSEIFPVGDDLPPMEAMPALPSVPLGEADRVLTARYKKVRTKIEKDPKVMALWEESQTASTFEQSRAALREYYRLLFAKMREADKTITARCDTMEKAYLERLSQTRIEPTIPLSPPPPVEDL